MVLFSDSFRYETENVARSFFPDLSVSSGPLPQVPPEDGFIYASAARDGGSVVYSVYAEKNGSAIDGRRTVEYVSRQDAELGLCRLLYDKLCDLTGEAPPWGVVTGVRPSKRLRTLLESGMDREECLEYMQRVWYCSRDKSLIAEKAAEASIEARKLSGPKSFSLYVSIPFCPSRCRYCSFVSKTIGKQYGLVDDYMDALCRELVESGRIAKDLGLRLETVYVGGGTPTSVSASQLSRLMDAILGSFDMSTCREFTVEAGRPDTIDGEKLGILKSAGVDRISINPQSAEPEVLRRAGRVPGPEMVEKAFSLARKTGFRTINSDLIAGLEGDTPEGFARSLEWLEGLGPENITVHALTLKRAADLKEEGIKACEGVPRMISHAGEELGRHGYEPYYMYRLKGTADGLENTGFTICGHISLYNVFIIDEVHSIISCGAGGMTKMVGEGGKKISRIPNYKYPAEYIAGIDKELEGKEKIYEFYTQHDIAAT
ncbi:MAG: coproporphyrinogen dehydrogenase HemZ [Oscillospiraceae bacterium]|jgi:oxygen-independent coproporphyrinogen-3 oxidase